MLRHKSRLLIRLSTVSVLTFVCFFYVARPYNFSSSIADSKTLYLNKIVYFFKNPQVTDNVIIQSQGKRALVVGQIVALPGDRVETDDGVLFINSYPYPNGFPRIRGKYYNKELGEDEFFIISLNSRPDVLGIVDRKGIAGKLWAIEE